MTSSAMPGSRQLSRSGGGAGWSRLYQYGIGVAASAGAVTTAYLFWPEVSPALGVLLLSAVTLSAWLGGFGPGLLTTVVSVVTIALFISEPLFVFESSDLLRLVTFSGVALLISYISRVRRRAEQRLREANALLQAVFEASPLAIVVVDRDLVVRLWNPPAERLFGWRADEVMGQVLPLVPPEKEAAFSRLRETALGEAGHSSADVVRRRKDGSLIHVSASWAPLPTDYAGRDAMVGMFADNEARHRAQEALRRSEEGLQLAFDAAKAWSWEVDLRTGTITRSRDVAELYGLAPGSFTPAFEEYFEKHVHADDRARVRAALEEGMRSGRESDIEYRIVRPDGEVRWVYARGQAYFDAEGRPASLRGISMDVTARKALERARQESERKFRAVADTAAVAIYIHDGRNLVYVNQAAEEITGYSAAELYAGDMWSLVHPEHREFVKQRAAARLAGALTPPRYEFCIVRKSGETRWLDFSATVIEFGGRPAILATALDVTERKQAEAALRVSEKLAATGRLAATIAHEINNPLASVTNVLYLLGQHATLDARGLDYVRLAQEELARIVQITRQMLAFYREAAAPVEVRVTDVVDNVLELYHRRIANTGLKLRKEYYTDTSVPGFPGELRQVFSNLVVNAIDAAGEDGRLRIRVRAGRDWARPERRGVRVTVADSGPGIAPANRKRIFEPFFTTKGEKGTGLGLWVTHGIVHKHDGSIRMYSSTHPAHRGTVFSVFLPQRAVSLPRPGWQVPAEAPADSVA